MSAPESASGIEKSGVERHDPRVPRIGYYGYAVKV